MRGLEIAPARPDEWGAVDALLERAFGHERVAAIVAAIRGTADCIPDLALVARVGGAPVGFVMVSRADLDEGDVHRDVLNLSPLAVLEPWRRRGIGAALVRAVLDAAEERTDLPRAVVLEGSPTYYGRLGFEHAPARGIEIELPDWAPREAAQVYRLRPHDSALRGRVRYPPAFAIPELADAADRLLGRPVRVIRALTGGLHAVTILVRDGDRELVARRFPAGDTAVRREVDVLPRLQALDGLAPELVADDGDRVILTSRIPGGAPDPDAPPAELAPELARALAAVHRIDPGGLPTVDGGPPGGPAVLVHGDFWCGNALWSGVGLTGIVDWSGAGAGPPERDVAWCRNDLVLLGDPHAADVFVEAYRTASGRDLVDLAGWDRWAAERARPVVETWAPNYAGIGRPEVDGPLLRSRLEGWMRLLAGGAGGD